MGVIAFDNLSLLGMKENTVYVVDCAAVPGVICLTHYALWNSLLTNIT